MAKKALVTAESKPKLDFSSGEFNAVINGAQLLTVQQLRLEMSGSPDLYKPAENLKLATSRGLKSCAYQRETRSMAAIFQYSVTAKSGRTRAFRCAAEFLVIYRVPEDSPEDAAKAACNKLGMFAAYPYFRAVAAQMAWNAGLDLPPLPTISAKPVLGKSTVVEYTDEDQAE